MLDLETVDQVKSPVSLQELLPCVDVCDIALKLFHVFLSHMKYLIQYFLLYNQLVSSLHHFVFPLYEKSY